MGTAENDSSGHDINQVLVCSQSYNKSPQTLTQSQFHSEYAWEGYIEEEHLLYYWDYGTKEK